MHYLFLHVISDKPQKLTKAKFDEFLISAPETIKNTEETPTKDAFSPHAKLPQIKALKRPEVVLSPTHAKVEESTPVSAKSESDYPIEPKVNIPYSVKEGETPRRVILERKKRQYAHEELNGLFSSMKKPSITLSEEEEKQVNAALGAEQGIDAVLPLDLFDNNDLETRTVHEWLGLTEKEFKKLPGTVNAAAPLESCAMIGDTWTKGSIVGYNKLTGKWIFSAQESQSELNRYYF